MTDIAADGPSSQHVLVDLLNEPDSAKLTWDRVCSTITIVCHCQDKVLRPAAVLHATRQAAR